MMTCSDARVVCIVIQIFQLCITQGLSIREYCRMLHWTMLTELLWFSGQNRVSTSVRRGHDWTYLANRPSCSLNYGNLYGMKAALNAGKAWPWLASCQCDPLLLMMSTYAPDAHSFLVSALLRYAPRQFTDISASGT